MGKRVFVAGATGVIGRRLIPLLVSGGHQVIGLARTAQGATLLESFGAKPACADAFDADGLAGALASAAPEVVVNQLTDLSHGFEQDRIAETLKRNAAIRQQGTANLIAAAKKAGAGRFIAQSIAFVYAAGNLPHREDAPLDGANEGPMAETVRAVSFLEQQVEASFGGEGVILRYGNLYGPGTGHGAPYGPSPLHVDAAALAALLAIEHGTGIYNVTDDGGEAVSDKAKRDLHWDPGFRLAARS